MEAIGTLAGGVAHDFNNILAGILGGLSLLELDLGDRMQRQADIREMKSLVERGADLAKQLLGFGHRGKYDARPLDLAQVTRQTGTMFSRTRRDVTLQYDFAQDLKAVLMDHTQLEQILLNLFVNAGQAMPRGGRILLRAENVLLSKEQTEIQGAKPGPFVKLVVADTGAGMDAATQERIFEPFFTTKPAGQGSGLGLASVYGIVKNHGGMITVESAPGNGATFTIFLPSTDQPVEARRGSVPAPAPAGQGVILVVDDEEQLLRMGARMLEALGYEAMTACCGEEALEVVRKHKGRLTLVILDMTMPGMSGAATFDALRQIAPDLKVLLASGFSVEGQAQALLSRGANGFLQKPFDVSALAAKLKTLELWAPESPR
jgi:CheY-like chemotaxis protein